MVNKLILENFQSHKKSLLEFHKGLNVIVGESDSGKSAIIRGLKLVTYNEPNGDEYRSNWGGATSVTIETNKDAIKRTKTNSKNLYELGSIDTPFTAFGQSVPDEIKEALNMEGVNLQQQLDAPFLISETSGKVALHFNKVANLDKIDTATQKIQKQINTINSETKHRKKELEIKQDKLKEFEGLDSLEWDLKDIEELETERNKKAEQAKDLNKLGNQLYGIEQEIYLAEQEIKAENEIDSILELHKQKRTVQEKYVDLTKVRIKLSNINTKIEFAENQIKAELNINKVLELYKNKQKAVLSANNLEKLYNTSNKINKELTSKETILKELEKEYKKEFPKICPLCNTKIK